MTNLRRALVSILIGMTLAVSPFVSAAHAQQSGKKAFTFHGKVEKVDAKDKTLTVNGEKVDGWMGAMTMVYGVDKDDVLKQVKSGDQITAKVYEGDFKTLFEVKIDPPKPGAKK